MTLILGSIFLFFVVIYAFVAAAVLYHLWHYTLPGWRASRIVVPVFIAISSVLFILAGYFLMGLA